MHYHLSSPFFPLPFSTNIRLLYNLTLLQISTNLVCVKLTQTKVLSANSGQKSIKIKWPISLSDHPTCIRIFITSFCPQRLTSYYSNLIIVNGHILMFIIIFSAISLFIVYEYDIKSIQDTSFVCIFKSEMHKPGCFGWCCFVVIIKNNLLSVCVHTRVFECDKNRHECVLLFSYCFCSTNIVINVRSFCCIFYFKWDIFDGVILGIGVVQSRGL